MTRLLKLLLLPVLAMPLFIGCSGDGLGRVPISGEVTYDGQPVVDGVIRFEPQRGTNMPIVIEPVKNGRYTTDTTGGVPPGNYQVKILSYHPDDPPPSGPTSPPRRQLLPKKYNSQSTLELTIETGQSELTQNFTLAR